MIAAGTSFAVIYIPVVMAVDPNGNRTATDAAGVIIPSRDLSPLPAWIVVAASRRGVRCVLLIMLLLLLFGAGGR